MKKILNWIVKWVCIIIAMIFFVIVVTCLLIIELIIGEKLDAGEPLDSFLYIILNKPKK
jgi:hypothetical protein